jgi:hypothetical protein
MSKLRRFSTRALAAAAVVASDVSVIETEAFAAVGDRGGAKYDKISAAPDVSLRTNPAFLNPGAGAYWFSLRPQRGVHVRAFGAKADANIYPVTAGTDDLPSFNAALKYAISLGYFRPDILTDSGCHYLSDTFEFEYGTTRLVGNTNPREGSFASAIVIPVGKVGVSVSRHNTHVLGDAPADREGGDGSAVDGVALFSMANGDPRLGSEPGFLLRARATLRNVAAHLFAGHGAYIFADEANWRGRIGNANLWHINHFSFQFNGADGYFVGGDNANAGNASHGNCSFNLGWGSRDASFLRNTGRDIHYESNGMPWVLGDGTVVSATTANHNGKLWTIWPGSEAEASTTEPGTDPSIWQEWRDANGPTFAEENHGVPWVSGQTFWRSGGAFCNGWNYGAYTEGGPPPAHIDQGQSSVEGLHGASYTPGSYGNLQVGNSFENGVEAVGYKLRVRLGNEDRPSTDYGTILYAQTWANNSSHGLPLRFRIDYPSGDYIWDILYGGYSGTFNQPLRFTGITTTTRIGGIVPDPTAVVPNGIIMNNNRITWGVLSQRPVEANFGDRHLNMNVASGQPEYWYCSTPGNPATWTAKGTF